MKLFGKSRTAEMVEEYHPLASIVILISVGLLKYYHPENFLALTDVSYPSTMKHGPEDSHVEHYRKGTNDMLFVFFFLNVVTVARYVFRKAVLEVIFIIFLTISNIYVLYQPLTRQFGLSKGLSRKFIDAGWFTLYYIVATGWGYYIFRDVCSLKKILENLLYLFFSKHSFNRMNGGLAPHIFGKDILTLLSMFYSLLSSPVIALH